MKKLPENYVVICNNATETTIVNNYIDDDNSVFNFWEYVVNSSYSSNIFSTLELVELWFKYRNVNNYETLTFKEFNDIINKEQEMENKLPKVWHLKITPDNKKIINDVKIKQHELYENLFEFDYVYVQSLGVYDGEFGGVNNYYENSVEITTEQFKSYYLKENKTEMKKQTLTRNQLIKLYNADNCTEWKSEIENILKLNVLIDNIEIPASSLELLKSKGSVAQKKLVTDLKIELSKTAKELYLENQTKCGLSIGDTVKVTRTSEKYENGWSEFWNDSMNSSVGKTFIIKNFDNDNNGFRLENNYWYPYFVLEKVVEEWIPFTFEDDLLGMKVISKDKKHKSVIMYQDKYDVYPSNVRSNYKNLFNYYTFLDGTPCGKLKQ